MPLLVGHLCDPFATAYFPLIQSSLYTLQAVIINDWPRIGYYRGEIFKGITMCWCRILNENSQSPESRYTQHQLVGTLKILQAALRDDEDALMEIREALKCDTRLRGLQCD